MRTAIAGVVVAVVVAAAGSAARGADGSADEAEVLKLDQRIADGVVRGDTDSVKAEMHGDVAITYGRYLAHTTTGDDPGRRWFSVWFERVYAKRDGRWIYLSHRTVHGPTFGADRKSVSDK